MGELFLHSTDVNKCTKEALLSDWKQFQSSREIHLSLSQFQVPQCKICHPHSTKFWYTVQTFQQLLDSWHFPCSPIKRYELCSITWSISGNRDMIVNTKQKSYNISSSLTRINAWQGTGLESGLCCINLNDYFPLCDNSSRSLSN